MNRILILLAFVLATGAPGILAQPPDSVSADEAACIAQNWLRVVTRHQGRWGTAPRPRLAEVQPFQRGARVLGYYCRIQPQGYIIIPARKQLSPIKAYSDSSDFDPSSNRGFVDVIKVSLERSLVTLAQRDAVPSTNEAVSPGTADYSTAWNELGVAPDTFVAQLQGETPQATFFAQVGPLLSSRWHQYPPYNGQCPLENCNNDQGGRALVGCVATAAAQIMRYWAWPPSGPSVDYDWPYMLGEYTWDPEDSRWEDGNGAPCTARQLEAVALICADTGVAASSSYGCDETSAWLGGKLGRDMTEAFEESFRYHSDTDWELREITSASSWWDMIRADLDQNRPLQYGIQTSWLLGGHSMVCDGWQQTDSIRLIHLNYGWGGSTDGWYALDSIEDSMATSTESVIRHIRPQGAVGPTVSGTYPLGSFPYRYFDQDATGTDAVFASGQNLQFLTGMRVEGTSVSTAEAIKFRGSPGLVTRLYAGGSQSKGIRIDDGGIRLYGGGGIRFPK